MKTFYFSRKPRRSDPLAAMTVQLNLEQLAEAFDKDRNANIRGTASIIASGTQVTVTHNFGSTAYSESVTPQGNPGGAYWVSNKTANSFRINLAVAAGSTIAFDWTLRGDY